MGRVIIKTVDGNRYEVSAATEIVATTVWGINALAFMTDDAVKYIAVQNIVSVTVRED